MTASLRTNRATAVVALLGIMSAPARAAELQPRTAAAFDRYTRATEARMDREIAGEAPFLWVDRLAADERRRTRDRLMRGEIVVERLRTTENGRGIDVPDGLIHHWVGTIFIPRATAAAVVKTMQDYDRYAEIYAPNVQQSRMLARDGDRFVARLRLFMKKVISVVLDTENDVRYSRLEGPRVHVRSYATRIQEVRDPGTPDETLAPIGNDGGYLWRFNNYCSIEEQSGGSPAPGPGVLMQCESVSLSRGIPIGLGWIVGPFVTSIPRESLEFTLRSLRGTLPPG